MHYDHNISKESHQIKLYVVLKDAIGPSWRFDLIFRFMICNCDSSIAVNGIFVYTIVLAANANYLHNPTYGSFHKNDSIQLVHFNAPTYRRFTNEFFHIRSLWLVGIFFFPTVNSDNPLLYLNSSLCLWSGTKNGQTFLGYQRSFPCVELQSRTATCLEGGSCSQIPNFYEMTVSQVWVCIFSFNIWKLAQCVVFVYSIL